MREPGPHGKLPANLLPVLEPVFLVQVVPARVPAPKVMTDASPTVRNA